MSVVPPGALVLGAAQFGQDYGNGPDRSAPSPDTVSAILRQASALGVVDVDTARAYGDSELTLGAAARDMPELRMVTKIAPLGSVLPGTADDADPPAVDRAVRESLTASLAALGRESVDTVLLHRAADLWVGGRAAATTLQSLVDAGLAGRWGVSLSTPAELLAALAIPGLRYVQLPFNLLDRRWLDDEVRQALAAHPQVHITVRSALLQGLLVGSDPARWPAVAGVDAAAGIDRLRGLEAEFDADSLLALAIRYVRAHPWVSAVVLGLRRIDQLPGLVDAVAAPPLTPDQVDRVHREIPAAPLDLVDPSRWPPRSH